MGFQSQLTSVRSMISLDLIVRLKTCSTREMSSLGWAGGEALPLTCPKDHPWDANQVTISWVPCDCPTNPTDPGHAHLVVHCPRPGCSETWQTKADVLIGVIKDQGRGTAADRDVSHAIAAFDNVWTLLAQAPEHHSILLRPFHPSAARIARLGSWIQSCVTAIDEAEKLKASTAHSDQVAHVEEVATGIATVVDSFHMYASMLERFRKNNDMATSLPMSGSLAAVADDERVLLTCRATLRKSIQQLIASL